MSSVTITRDGVKTQYSYEQTAANDGRSLTRANGFKSASISDAHGRLEYKQLQHRDVSVSSMRYKYVEGVADKDIYGKTIIKPETKLVSSITYADGLVLEYEYDQADRIVQINANGALQSKYIYDGLGRLTREDNADLGTSTDFVYDKGGNITNKSEYAFADGIRGALEESKTYGYTDSTWKDKLTSYTGYNDITYDAGGNPLSYNGYGMTWEKGRQLRSMTKGADTLSFKYNANGVRTEKCMSGRTTKFIVNGSKILYQTYDNGQSIRFEYDENNQVIGCNYKDKDFFYKKNLQGDVTAILDTLGREVCTYTYDAWGKCTMHQNVLTDVDCYCDGTDSYCDCDFYEVDVRDREISYNNPFRYRSYYYDVETGLYYLNSRYYDSETGRFLNADDAYMLLLLPQGITNKNLFAYCNNNPINKTEFFGYFDINAFASQFDPNVIFATFFSILAKSLSKGLASISGFVAKIATPPAAKAFWWKPWLIAVVVIGIIAIILAVVLIIYYSRIHAIGGCEEWAKAKEKELKDKRIPCRRIKLIFENLRTDARYNGGVIREDTGNMVGNNSFHMGVKIFSTGIVCCNVFPDGLSESTWKEMFNGYDDKGRAVHKYAILI